MTRYEKQHWRAGCRETGPSGSESAWQKPVSAKIRGAVIRLYQEHPKAFNDVTLGLIFLILASGGGIAALLGT